MIAVQLFMYIPVHSIFLFPCRSNPYILTKAHNPITSSLQGHSIVPICSLKGSVLPTFLSVCRAH